MSSASLLKILREQRANVVSAATQLGDTFGNDRTLNARDRVELEQHFADIDLLDERIERMTRAAMAEADGGRRNGYVYERGGEYSWLVDVVQAQRDAFSPAHARLEQHHAEVQREIRNIELARESAFSKAAADGGWGVERRALSTATGAGGEFAPPLWAISDFGHLPRAAAPLLSLIDVMPLPGGIESISVPKIATDPGVSIGTLQNTAMTDDGTSTTTSSTANVQTISARVTLSQQLVDQANYGNGAGIDELYLEQLLDDYAAKFEAQLIAGNNTNQLNGLLTISGTNTVTYTDASPTGSAAQVAVAKAASQVAGNRLRAPGAILMAGRRWFWMSSQEDTATRPLGSIGAGTMVDPTGSDAGPFGPLHGLGVYLDGALPLTQGTGNNQDVVIVTRPRDLLVWQSTPTIKVMAPTYADSAQVVIVFTGFVAAALDVQPTATSIVSGTGLVAPSGY